MTKGNRTNSIPIQKNTLLYTHTHKHIAKLSGDGAILTFSLPPWDVVNELNAVLVGDNE